MTQCPQCLGDFSPTDSGGLCPRCALRSALTVSPDDTMGADYERIAELGRGAMGVVWLARQRSLDRLVALKVVARDSHAAEWLEARLLREARAAASLAHPHIVAIHDIVRTGEHMFFAMDYCEGGDLRARVRTHPLTARAAGELGAMLADAVAHAHTAGVLHRDLKPANVLLTAAGSPKISDFGLTSPIGGGDLTRPGDLAGSPAYLAPEALDPNTVPGVGADIYGLGAVLYECLTGRPPFVGESVPALLAQIIRDEPVAPHLLNPSVPRDLDTIITHCLQKSPASRYASAADLRDDLRRFLADQPIHARPLSAPARALRWARRHAALAAAGALGLALLLTIAIGSSVAAVRLEHEQTRTAAARDRAQRSEAEAREQLRTALVAQARAHRLTGREGQRTESLAALKRAAEIRPAADLRHEVIAALTLPDWTPHTELRAWSDPGLSTATPFPGFDAFIHETEDGVFSRRTFPGGEVRWRWTGGVPSAGQTVVSPDGRHVAVRLRDDTVHLLDAATGAPRFTLTGRPIAFKASRIWGYGVDLAFSPDGRRLAVTRPEGGVSIHATDDGRTLSTWDSPAWIVSLAFSHNGRWLAVGGSREREHNTTALIDSETGRTLAQDTPLSRVDFVTWSDDDQWIAVGSRPVQIRSAATFAVRAVVPDRAALHGKFLPGADQILLTEQIGQTRLWDIETGRLVLTKSDSGRPGVWFDGVPPRQWRYFSAGTVDLQTFQPSPILTVQRASKGDYTVPSTADPLDLSPDGRWLVLGGWQQPRLIHLQTGAVHPVGPAGPLGSAAVARLEADGETLWIGQSGGPLRRHRLRFAAGGAPSCDEGETVVGHDGFLPTALHRATGRLVLTHYQRGVVRILDCATRSLLSTWELPRASHAAFSPDGEHVLTNAEPTPGAHAEVRDVRSGALVHTLAATSGRLSAWSPDGRTLLVGTGQNETRLVRPKGWTPGPPLPTKLQSASGIATFSSDGRWLVLRAENELHLLRAENAEVLARIEIPDSVRYLAGLRFSTDDQTLIAVRNDGRVDLWHVPELRKQLAALGLDWAQ